MTIGYVTSGVSCACLWFVSTYLGGFHDDLIYLVSVKTFHTSFVVIESHSGEEALFFGGCHPILHPNDLLSAGTLQVITNWAVHPHICAAFRAGSDPSFSMTNKSHGDCKLSHWAFWQTCLYKCWKQLRRRFFWRHFRVHTSSAKWAELKNQERHFRIVPSLQSLLLQFMTWDCAVFLLIWVNLRLLSVHLKYTGYFWLPTNMLWNPLAYFTRGIKNGSAGQVN